MELQDKLKTAKEGELTSKERHNIRNKICAQVTRIKRKGEAIYLNELVKRKDDQFKLFVSYLTCSVLTQA